MKNLLAKANASKNKNLYLKPKKHILLAKKKRKDLKMEKFDLKNYDFKKIKIIESELERGGKYCDDFVFIKEAEYNGQTLTESEIDWLCENDKRFVEYAQSLHSA